MYNSNLSLTVPPLLGLDGGICTTPRTPEILNSLMAMTNPLEYSYPVATQSTLVNGSSTSTTSTCNNNNNANNSVSQASHDSHSNSSDSPLDSPAGHGRTPSVQQTRSQLIKAGVKLLIQNKRKHSGCDSSDGNESSSGGGGGGGRASVSVRGNGRRAGNGASHSKIRRDTATTNDQLTSEDDMETARTTSGCSSTGGGPGSTSSPRCGLTPEDEDRRRRRRERNKIAATKCRMKKRERTVNLVNESETLDAQNKDLKSQVTELENQRRKLMEVLQAHSSTCVHQKGYQPLPSLSTITNNNCKFLNDLNFMDAAGSGELKYSECLKTGSELGNDNVLPPGYCKLSPTDVNYGTPSDVMDVNSFASQALKSEYIPSSTQQPERPTRQKPGPKPRQKAKQRNVAATTSTATTPATEVLPPVTTVAPVPTPLPSADFILKNELIDTSSPYTTVQSADRFLFENSLDLYNNNNNDSNTLDGHHTNDSDKLTSLALKDNASNALLEFNANFDTSHHLLKASDYGLLATNHQPQHTLQQQQQQHLHQPQPSNQQQQQCHLQSTLGLLQNTNHLHQQQHHQQSLHNSHQMLPSQVPCDFLILPEHDGSEFTDLDSGITSYTNINGSCLA